MAMVFLTAMAQKTSNDSDTTVSSKKSKEINIGNLSIVIKNSDHNHALIVDTISHKKKIHSNISTNWWVFDLGFSNYIDNTNYALAGNSLINRPIAGIQPIGESDFKLRTVKSVNVNIWIFMQRLNLIKHKLNLKYGLGLELNNYRYKSNTNISYKEDGIIPYSNPINATNKPFIFRDSITFSKNKLAADYITIPLMVNFNPTPNKLAHGFSISAGVSAGYLYSSRNKQKSAERGKRINKGEYNLEQFKFAFIGEIGMGSVKLYGSYSPKSMYKNDLNMRPYTIGLRFSNW